MGAKGGLGRGDNPFLRALHTLAVPDDSSHSRALADPQGGVPANAATAAVALCNALSLFPLYKSEANLNGCTACQDSSSLIFVVNKTITEEQQTSRAWRSAPVSFLKV